MKEIKIYCDICKVYIDRTEEVQSTIYLFDCIIHTNFKGSKPDKTITRELCGVCIDKVNICLTGKKFYDK